MSHPIKLVSAAAITDQFPNLFIYENHTYTCQNTMLFIVCKVFYVQDM